MSLPPTTSCSQLRIESSRGKGSRSAEKLGASLANQELENRIDVGLIIAVKRDTWTINFRSELARRLFKTYFGFDLNELLPPCFAQAINRSSREFWEGLSYQGKLQVSFYEINDASVFITLEEINPVPSRSPEALLVLGLTPRESEVLFWIAEGKTSPEIALILNTAPNTIKKHVSHILEKLALENRWSAALLANDILRSGSRRRF